MTRGEAISVLERVAHTESKWPGTEDTLEALDMAISALRAQQDHFREVTKKVEPMTNADRIRAMSDEELVNVVPCPLGFSMFRCPIERQCGPCKREWLKQPVVEETL